MLRAFSSGLTRTQLILLCVSAALAANVSCVKIARRARDERSSARAPNALQTPADSFGSKPAPARPVDINRAAPEELARLPGIGAGLAARIVEHRARYGPFRRAEHLLMVRGIGERRFERLRPFVAVE